MWTKEEPYYHKAIWEKFKSWKKVFNNSKDIKCKHEMCPECHGSGIKDNGQSCIHMIICPCPKCTPYSL